MYTHSDYANGKMNSRGASNKNISTLKYCGMKNHPISPPQIHSMSTIIHPEYTNMYKNIHTWKMATTKKLMGIKIREFLLYSELESEWRRHTVRFSVCLLSSIIAIYRTHITRICMHEMSGKKEEGKSIKQYFLAVRCFLPPSAVRENILLAVVCFYHFSAVF